MIIKLAKLKELAAAAGLQLAGVTAAAPLNHMLERLQRRLSEGRMTPFEEQDPALRISPESLLAGCRSIVVLGLPSNHPLHPYPGAPSGPRGEVARFARGLDYHRVLEHKAKQLERLIRKEYSGLVRSRILVDRSPLLERELAQLAGLGRVGENCTLVTPQYGSYVTLGTILIDRELETGAPLAAGCRGCSACREACPTGALSEPNILNPARCLSYLTQAAGVIPLELRPLFGKRLYGCDRCQEVCPENHKAKQPPPGSTVFPFFPANPLLQPLLDLTQKEFTQTIGMSAAGWRGKTTLQRNAVVALGNCGDPAAVPLLAQILRNDPRTLLRLHAAWALGRFGNSEARIHLDNSCSREPDLTVREEIFRVLEM